MGRGGLGKARLWGVPLPSPGEPLRLWVHGLAHQLGKLVAANPCPPRACPACGSECGV